jgi:hypothetical protein
LGPVPLVHAYVWWRGAGRQQQHAGGTVPCGGRGCARSDGDSAGPCFHTRARDMNRGVVGFGSSPRSAMSSRGRSRMQFVSRKCRSGPVFCVIVDQCKVTSSRSDHRQAPQLVSDLRSDAACGLHGKDMFSVYVYILGCSYIWSCYYIHMEPTGRDPIQARGLR